MLQQITIQTSDSDELKSTLKIALARESKLLAHSIQRTRQSLALFEQRYQMSSQEFGRKFESREIPETLDFLDWWMELEALRYLESKQRLIHDAHVE